MSKSEIRDRYRKERQKLSKTQVDLASVEVSKRCIAFLKNRKNIKAVAGYQAFDQEIDLSFCFEWCKTEGISVFLIPKTIDPLSEKVQNNIDIWFVPGVVFSKTHHRLGFGKGIYDQLLSKTTGYKIGIGYQFKGVPEWQSDPWDIPMDHLILGEVPFFDHQF